MRYATKCRPCIIWPNPDKSRWRGSKCGTDTGEPPATLPSSIKRSVTQTAFRYHEFRYDTAGTLPASVWTRTPEDGRPSSEEE